MAARGMISPMGMKSGGEYPHADASNLVRQRLIHERWLFLSHTETTVGLQEPHLSRRQ